MPHIICSICRVSILAVQLCCWWSISQCSRSHHPADHQAVCSCLPLKISAFLFYRSYFLSYPEVKMFSPIKDLWTSGTGGAVIYIGSEYPYGTTLMVSSRRPRVIRVLTNLSTGRPHFTFYVVEVLRINIPYIIYIVSFCSAGSLSRDITDWCQSS